MISKQRIVPIFCLLGLLSACTSQVNQYSLAVSNPADCPTESTPFPVTTSKQKGFYDRFDYHIRNIVADASLVRFQTSNSDFVFCRRKNSWTVRPGTLPKEFQSPKDGAQYYKELANPPLKKIDFNGKTYQYRVLLEPNPFSGSQTRTEAQKVIFELIAPDKKQPQYQTLYTLNQLRQAKIGASLGVPTITAALKHNNRLFWSIASEQGEGANGIATIVSYEPQKNESIIIQPEGIKRQQITDLVITSDSQQPTFWMGTKISGEGNGYLPGMGLVAYRPNSQNLKSGSIKFYQVNNSPIIGAIPDKLKLDKDTLWVGTGNGICQVKWQAPDEAKSWSCDRFSLFTKLPKQGIPLYSSSASKNPAARLSPAKDGETVEVLWFSPVDYQTAKGRYEVRYPKGFTVTLDEQGAEFFPQEVEQIRANVQPVKSRFHWPGYEWHWDGARFVRGLDEVAMNAVGGGPRGIGSNRGGGNRPLNSNAMRGDFDLLNLSRKSTRVKYYSGWVDEANIKLYLTVVPQERPDASRPNPLEALAKQLQP